MVYEGWLLLQLHLGKVLLDLLLDHALHILLHLLVNLGLNLHLNLLLHLSLDHLIDLLHHRTLHHLHGHLLLKANLLLHVRLELLLRHHSHSLMDPKKSLKAVLIIVYHVFISVFFNRQFLTKCHVDLLKRLLEISDQGLDRLLNLGNDRH